MATLANTKTFLLSACYESFAICPERKYKIVFFALFYTTRLSTINYPMTCLKDIRAIGKVYNDAVLS